MKAYMKGNFSQMSNKNLVKIYKNVKFKRSKIDNN